MHTSDQKNSNATRHWKILRLTAVLSIPLCLWLVYSIVDLAGADYATFTNWLRQPLNAVLMIVTIAVTFYHASLGVHEILEDYVHNKSLLCASMLLKKAFFIIAALVCIGTVIAINQRTMQNPQVEMRTGVLKNPDGPIR